MTDYWYKKNKTQLLRGFCAVMEEGGVIKASKKLNISQSSISLQISSLERDLDFQLFIRENQKVIPTEEAKRLYKISKKALEEVDMIFTNSKEAIKTDYDNIIRLAGHSYMLSHILPPFFKKMIAKNPKVQFELSHVNQKEAMDMLEHGMIDIAVFPAIKKELPKSVEVKEFYKCKSAIIMSKHHPLAKVPEKEITWDLLAKYDFLTLGKGVTAQGLKKVMQDNALNSRFILHHGTWEICVGIVNEGVAITGSDYRYLQKLQGNTDLIIKNCPWLLPEYEFFLLKNKNTIISKSSADFISILTKKIKQPSL